MDILVHGYSLGLKNELKSLMLFLGNNKDLSIPLEIQFRFFGDLFL
jgi:hypothetical protein